MSKNLNYNTDLLKHFVRYYGWLRPFKTMINYVDNELDRGNRNVRVKYLTFCAVQAIDVFLLEYVKYIYRDDSTGRLENVYFCENDEEAFSIIQKLIGSEKQGFFGDFKDIVLQEPSNFVSSEDPFDEPESVEEREGLRLFEIKNNLISKFPFDIINLDFYGNFFPNKEKKYSDSLKTYKEVLKLQREDKDFVCNRFLMYLTVYTPDINERRFVNTDLLTDFEKVLLENLAYEEFAEGMEDNFGHIKPKDIDVFLKFIYGFAKQVLFKETFETGWVPELREIFTYQRYHSDGKPHKETCFVIEYTRDDELLQDNDILYGQVPEEYEDHYKQQIFDLICSMPMKVPEEHEIPEEVRDSLQKVVEFRNEFLESIGLDKNRLFI